MVSRHDARITVMTIRERSKYPRVIKVCNDFELPAFFDAFGQIGPAMADRRKTVAERAKIFAMA